MSTKSAAKTHDEVMVDFIHAYRKEHGPCEMEDVSAWILANRLLPEPTFNAQKALTRKLKLAARRKKMKDAQGRTMRELVAAKVERIDARGNRVFDVVWDHLHEMSASHALTVFMQRDEIIEKQSQSATRDLKSCLDNNPNLEGCEDQFVFKFMREDEGGTPMVAELSETPIIPKPAAEYEPHEDANSLTKKKRR